jgi:hypothetical protein
MTMGRKLVVPGISIDPSAPVLPSIDQAMPEQGLLVYIEPGHPFCRDASIENNVYFPNLAAEQAREATGIVSTNDTALKPILFATGSVIERSAKGGLHLIPGKVLNATVRASYAASDRPAAEWLLGSWVNDHRDHTFYVAQWGRWTRDLGQIVGGYSISAVAGNNELGQLFGRPGTTGEVVYPTDTRRIGWSQEGARPVDLNPYFLDGAFLSPAAGQIRELFRPIGFTALSADLNAVPAAVVYGYVLEDLTLSRRTYAQAHAAWSAKYTRDVKTDGGRYDGDTTPTTPE